MVGFLGKCLDVNKSGTADGTTVQLYACNGGINQQWKLEGGALKSALGKCLDMTRSAQSRQARRARAHLQSCDGSAGQRWANANSTLTAPGGRCLDVYRARRYDGAPLILWRCHGGPNQRWEFA